MELLAELPVPAWAQGEEANELLLSVSECRAQPEVGEEGNL